MNELLNADYDANDLPKGKLRSVTYAISFYVTIFSPRPSFMYSSWPIPYVYSMHIMVLLKEKKGTSNGTRLEGNTVTLFECTTPFK